MPFKLFLRFLQLYLAGGNICAIQFFYAGNDCTGNLLFDNHIRSVYVRIYFARKGTGLFTNKKGILMEGAFSFS